MNSTLIHLIQTLNGYLFYYYVNKICQKYQTKKLASNTVSLIHASTSSILGICYLFNNSSIIWIKLNSGGYFAFDTINLLSKGNYKFTDFIFLYHHIASHWYISFDPLKYQWPYILTWAEISNLPGYIVYYNIQKDKERKLWKGYKSINTKYWLRIQMFFYMFIRIFILAYYGFKELNGPNPKPLYFCAPVYLLGLIWTYVIYRQNQTFALQPSSTKSSKLHLL
jgi:hypothetical protein